MLETNRDVKYQLADIPLPNGVLRIDKVSVPAPTTIRLGHYTLPETDATPLSEASSKKVKEATILTNKNYSLATVPLSGWDKTMVVKPEGIHPVSKTCGLIMTEKQVQKEHIMVTLHLWKKGKKAFSAKELSPVKSVRVSDDMKTVEVEMADKTTHTITF